MRRVLGDRPDLIPTGVAVGSHGTVYVSNFGDSTATAAHPGEILKITGLS